MNTENIYDAVSGVDQQFVSAADDTNHRLGCLLRRIGACRGVDQLAKLVKQNAVRNAE